MPPEKPAEPGADSAHPKPSKLNLPKFGTNELFTLFCLVSSSFMTIGIGYLVLSTQGQPQANQTPKPSPNQAPQALSPQTPVPIASASHPISTLSPQPLASPPTPTPTLPPPLPTSIAVLPSPSPILPSTTGSPLAPAPTNQPRLDITFANRRTTLAQMAPKSIALTFDDGPDPTYTLQVLAKLRQYGAKATFFLVGKRVQPHCAIIRQIVSEGHELGNHTFTHPRLTELSTAAQRQEIADTQTAIQTCVGAAYVPRWFRSPYGRQDQSTLKIVHQLGLSSVLWSIDPMDWHSAATGSTIASDILQAKGRDVVVMHDGLEANPNFLHPKSASTRVATVASLDLFLSKMQAEGFQFVTLSHAFQPNQISLAH